MLAVADRERTLVITGNGDVLEPEHGIAAIGSGGAYAQRRRAPYMRTPSCRRKTSSKGADHCRRHLYLY